MAEYRFVSCWRVAAPLQAVFDVVCDSLRWPEWWQGARAVTELEAGNSEGIGSVRRYEWQSRLPYRLRFDARTTRILPLRELAAVVDGDLEGRGRWLFSHRDGITAVRHEWEVRTTRRWMNLAAPLVRRVFSANHDFLMRRGAEGLASRLSADLLEVSSTEIADGGRESRYGRGLALPALAGVSAGGVATLVQMGLWRLAAPYPVLHMLWRDTRLAAALLLGRTILPPPATPDARAFLAAATVHLALSFAYALLFRLFGRHLGTRSLVPAGGAFGLILFGVNMYGFTLLFPWFAVNRDWITALAHLAFGITLGGLYRYERICCRA